MTEVRTRVANKLLEYMEECPDTSPSFCLLGFVEVGDLLSSILEKECVDTDELFRSLIKGDVYFHTILGAVKAFPVFTETYVGFCA